MSAGWKILWLAVATFAAAFGAARWLVPDVVPVGYAEEPQGLMGGADRLSAARLP
jgi:hypothetical protein